MRHQLTSLAQQAMQRARFDLRDRHPMPSSKAVVLATALAAAVSLAADALLVALGTRIFPSTTGYVHFRFSDYATLTVIGVVIAGAAWPLVARCSPSPRWLYLRLAILVTLALWVPDLYLLARHQPVRVVVVLMVMHLAIALVTYNIVVWMAPVRYRAPLQRDANADPDGVDGSSGRRLATSLCVLVGVELIVGIATLIAVPTGRPSGLLPDEGRAVYLVHTVLGVPLALGAMTLWVNNRRGPRMMRLCVWIGGIGVAVAATGGLLAASHPLRLVGAALMLLGSLVAGFGYLLPSLDALDDNSAKAT